jgi:hypothetical protein
MKPNWLSTIKNNFDSSGYLSYSKQAGIGISFISFGLHIILLKSELN